VCVSARCAQNALTGSRGKGRELADFSLTTLHRSGFCRMTELRKDRRTPLSLKIRCRSATVDAFMEQLGADISRGGIFIKTEQPLDVGSLLKFEFQLNTGEPVIHGVGRVAWRRPQAQSHADLPAGMGIKFIRLDDDSRAIVARIESLHGAGSRYERTEGAEFAPSASTPLLPVSTSDPSPSQADAPSARAALNGHAYSHPGGRTDSAPHDTSEFLASAIGAAGASREVESQARAELERARHDPHSVALARQLFGDLSEELADAVAHEYAGDLSSVIGASTLPTAEELKLSQRIPSMDELRDGTAFSVALSRGSDDDSEVGHAASQVAEAIAVEDEAASVPASAPVSQSVMSRSGVARRGRVALVLAEPEPTRGYGAAWLWWALGVLALAAAMLWSGLWKN